VSETLFDPYTMEASPIDDLREKLPPFGGTIQERFEDFRATNPHVEASLVRLARQAHRRGHRKIGIELLFAVLRWETMMKTNDPSSGFKLNDHYTSRYARLLMDKYPDLEGLFETRQLRSK
jgi:hypothetical protein